jgi:hypothetical protein
VTVDVAREPGDGGADECDLHQVVVPAHDRRAVTLADLHLHVGDHDALGAESRDVLFQPVPGVVPRLVHQLAPGGHLGVA